MRSCYASRFHASPLSAFFMYCSVVDSQLGEWHETGKPVVGQYIRCAWTRSSSDNKKEFKLASLRLCAFADDIGVTVLAWPLRKDDTHREEYMGIAVLNMWKRLAAVLQLCHGLGFTIVLHLHAT